MLLTGIKTPVGIKIFGSDLERHPAARAATSSGCCSSVPGTRSVYAERVAQGYFTDIRIDRDGHRPHGLDGRGRRRTSSSRRSAARTSTRTVEGRERYPVNVRYAARLPRRRCRRSSACSSRRRLARRCRSGSWRAIDADDRARDDPRRERPAGGLRLRRHGHARHRRLRRSRAGGDCRGLQLPAGYTLQWTGQYEFQVRARERLQILIPIVFFIIFLLLYMTFHSVSEALDRHALGGLRDDRRRHPAVAARLQLLGRRVGRATSRSTASPSRPAWSWWCTCTRRSTSGCSAAASSREQDICEATIAGSVLRLAAEADDRDAS